MKTIILEKIVNNTEVGKGGTHETYILVPQELDVSQVFSRPEERIIFFDVEKNDSVTIRLTVGREKRIVGLGPFYRNHDASAGDLIILKKVIDYDGIRYFIYCKKRRNILSLQKVKDGFEIRNPENQSLLQNDMKIEIDGELKSFSLSYAGKIKKRNDSPIETPVYDILINEKKATDKYANGAGFELLINNGIASIINPSPWKKQIIETEV